MAQQLMEQFYPPIQSDGLNTNTNTTLGGTIAVTGAATLSSTLAVTGRVTGSSSATFLKLPITLDATSGTSATLTATQSGSLVVMDSITGSRATLPAPQKGLYFDFVIATAATSGSHAIVTDAGTTFLVGNVLATGTGASALGVATMATFSADGSTIIALRMGPPSVGSAGTLVRAECISGTKWAISGTIVSGTAVQTTSPFKAV